MSEEQKKEQKEQKNKYIFDLFEECCKYNSLSKAELARLLGYKSAQQFHYRYSNGLFNYNDLQKLAEITGGKFVCYMEYGSLKLPMKYNKEPKENNENKSE